MTKIYIAAALVLALLGSVTGAWFHYAGVVSDRDKYKAESAKKAETIKEKEAAIVLQNQIIRTERQAVKDANDRATQYQATIKGVKDESENFRACVAAGSCGVRWKYQACDSVPSAATDRPVIAENIEHKRDFEQWAIDLRESIKLDYAQIEALKKENKIRADPGYCQPKPQADKVSTP